MAHHRLPTTVIRSSPTLPFYRRPPSTPSHHQNSRRGVGSCPWIIRVEHRSSMKGRVELQRWLEETMTAKCLGSGLKAYPHIDSKTKWFRDKYNVLMEMFRASGFTWDDTIKMIKCERQPYDDFCKNHKHAKGLWVVSFPFLDELGKIFGADRATGPSCEDYVETVDNLHNDNEAIDLDKDGKDEEEEEDGSVQLAQSYPQLSKRARKEKTSMGKGKKRMLEVTDLPSTFTNMSSNIYGLMSGMNFHLETITSAFTTIQQHEQKLVSNESSLTVFYECLDDEWKKDFILNLIHLDLPLFN
ncbi:hypothetical protein Cgig2_019843 [Carnegiea gigantea]|uniref:Myb/SANT-like domain-containing protein n=1 Tax=Carnegiea gigantea TaxID=171969 RepID=A0A9Q1JUC1_9CARY|nr:hypothetical protein Cgig2_019843 [Carnegiea gigantea]